MTRDPLLPVRLVDGVWTTEGAGSAAVPTEHHPGIMALGRGAEWPCSATLPPRPATDYARAFAEYNPPPRSEIVIPVTIDADEARRVAERVLVHSQRTVFAAVALDGSGVWAIGDSAEEARTGAVDRRDHFRDCARMIGDDFPSSETDAAWLDTLAIVTLSGTTESLRAIVAALDDVIPWCPADLWDSGDVSP